MTQGAEADSEPRRELFLGQADSLPQGLDVDLRGFVDLHPPRLPFLMRYSFAQTLLDAVKCFTGRD